MFTGVAAHTISRMPSLVAAGAGLMLATLATCGGLADPRRRFAGHPGCTDRDLRAHGGQLVLGEEVTSPPSGVVLYDTAPTALLGIYGDALPCALRQDPAPLSVRAWSGEGRLRVVW